MAAPRGWDLPCYSAVLPVTRPWALRGGSDLTGEYLPEMVEMGFLNYWEVMVRSDCVTVGLLEWFGEPSAQRMMNHDGMEDVGSTRLP
jgi:hypothetical protein